MSEECNDRVEDTVQEIYRLSSYDYPLPENQIAQQPTKQRDQSRLLVLDCTNNNRHHTQFETLCELISPGDLLVVNNTKVFPARLFGHKETGGKIEMLLLHFPAPVKQEEGVCQATTLALIKSSKRPKPGSMLHFSDALQAKVEALLPDGKAEVSLFYPAHADLEQLLEKYGEIPCLLISGDPKEAQLKTRNVIKQTTPVISALLPHQQQVCISATH